VNHHLFFLSFTAPVDKMSPEGHNASAGIINSIDLICLTVNKLKIQNVTFVL